MAASLPAPADPADDVVPPSISVPFQRHLEPRPATLTVRILTAVFLLIAVGALVTRFLVAPLDRFDEGTTLLKGMLVSQGAIPYRDFWTSYGPLDSFLLGALFHLLGQQVLVERMLAVALAIIFAMLSWWLTGLIGLRGPMRILMTGLIALDAITFPPPIPTVLVISIGLLGLASFLRNVERRSMGLSLAGGGLTGLASFTRPEFALVLAAGIGAGYAILLLNRQPGSARALLAFLAAALGTSSVLWAPLVVAAGWPTIFFSVIVHALVIFPNGRRIPLGQGDDGPAILVFSACFVAIWAWGAVRVVRHRSDPLRLARLSALIICAMLSFDWVLTRADAVHAMGAWPMTAVLLAVLLHERTGQRPALPGDASLSLVAIALFGILIASLAARDLARPTESVALPHAAIVGDRAWMPSSQLARVVAAIIAETPPGQPIFVGLQHNDEVRFNDTMIYFLAGRAPGTVFDEYIPGLTTDVRIQRTITCELARSGTRLAVLGPNTAGEPWNASARPGSTILDDWLRAHTVSRTTLSPYVLLTLRADAADPSCQE